MDRRQQELTRVCAEEYPRLVGLLALQVGDRLVAEELAQDTLLALCRHWGRVDRPTGDGGSAAWSRPRPAWPVCC